jgi:hypothetical protein
MKNNVVLCFIHLKILKMAKIIYGAGVSQMSGKQGGTVFSRNKSGAYTRTNRKGTNPNTASQQSRRANFRAASRYFRTLSAVQQQSFKDNAINYPQIDRLGQTVTLSGAQLANKFANLLKLQGLGLDPQEMGSPLFLASPLSLAIGSTTVAGVITVLTIDALFTDSGGGDTDSIGGDYTVVLKASKLMGNGFTAPKKKDFRVIAVLDGSEVLTNFDIKAAYQAVYGLGVVGGDNKMFISISTVSKLTPQSSAALIANKTI